MSDRDLTSEDVDAFLVELAALTRKHKIRIGGCGCCGSPYLEPCETSGKYTIDEFLSGEGEPWEQVEWDDLKWDDNERP